MSRVLLSWQGNTAVITLNRPQVRNAVDLPTIHELQAAVGEVEQRQETRCVIFTGAGNEAFCAGGDLRAFQALRTWEDAYSMSCAMQRALWALENLPVPVLGVLNGYALGGGGEAILASDVRIMEDHTHLSFKQLALGVPLGWGGAARLACDLGPRAALRTVLLGDRLTPAHALGAGLVDEVVPKGEGLARALVLGERFAQLPPLAVAALKRMTRQDVPVRIHQEATLFASTWVTGDHARAVEAFFEKRTPQWEGT